MLTCDLRVALALVDLSRGRGEGNLTGTLLDDHAIESSPQACGNRYRDGRTVVTGHYLSVVRRDQSVGRSRMIVQLGVEPVDRVPPKVNRARGDGENVTVGRSGAGRCGGT